MTPVSRGLGALAALAALAVPASAQVRASEFATISQTVDGTVITVEYSRPRIRGRSQVYGSDKVIPWGEVWTPGANWATTFQVSKDVTVNGHPLPKGKYSVWMKVEQREWTVVFDTTARLFHTQHPVVDSTRIHFPVSPETSRGPDVLTWSFPEVSSTGTTLRMAWADRAVSLEIVVPPSAPITLAADLAPRYIGEYSFQWASAGPDAPPEAGPPPPSVWKATYAQNKLLVDWGPAPFPEWSHLVLIKIGDDWFYPGAMIDGELFDVASDLVIEFTVAGGKATGFEIRGENDDVIGTGVRTK